MHEATVTIFNYYESTDGGLWYPHVLYGVHLETDRGQIIKKYGPDSTDKAVLHIPYSIISGQKRIVEVNKTIHWLPPKEWKKQSSDKLPETITFGTDMDFFILGAWEGNSVIKDDDYAGRRYDGFYAYMNAGKDFVFKITSVGGPYNLIPHFELLGK